ncbi:MAG: protein kinase [Candidatus Aminicenantales bacterium]|jgi:serine/threonine protein kinase/tetratricopeptide (TPR) repeat protein
MLNAGDKIQRYQIIRLLGKGGMGEVYLAKDTALDRHVALKFLPDELENDPRMRERFLREAKSAAALDHPFICKIYETGELHGKSFIAMEYVEGKTLKDRMEQERVPLREAIRITLEIGEALENAHKAGIVHRDLKPANIMISSQGHTKVMDFGLAKRVLPGGDTAELSRTLTQGSITEQGAIAGTISYMSPEQAKGENVDTRSDIFSLGIILDEMISGQHPFSKPSPIETLTSILRDPVPPAHIKPKSVNPVLNPILRKALAKKPEDRYQNVTDFANDLRKAQTEAGFRIRIPIRLASIVAGSVLIIALAVVGILKFRHSGGEGASKHLETEQKPISVLVADFENKTGDPVFEGALEQAFGIGLEGASFIKMYNRTRARTLMNELDSTANGKIKPEAAPLLCSREGINVVITGSIDSSGSGYVFDVWALDPLSYLRLAERSKTIATKAEVLKAADGLAAELRDDLSRIPAGTAQALTQETFTAASFEAMKFYAQAQDLVLAGKDDEAIQEYLKAIEKDPRLGRAYTGLALVYRNRGQDEQANKYFEKAMALIDQMTDREKFRTRGAYYFLNRDSKKAIEEYSALIQQFPMDSAAHTNLPLAYFFNREMQKAFEEGQRAVEFAPRNITARYNLVWYAVGAGKFDEAEKELQEVLKINPEFPEAQVLLALIQLAQDRPREAEKTYLELSTKGARANSLAAIGLADLALYEGRLNDARKTLDAGIASDLKNKFEDEATLKSLMRAQTLLAQGDQGAAVRGADRVAASSKKGSDLFSMAEIYIQAGQLEKALKVAETLNAKLQPELQAYARLIEGEVAQKKGNILGAIDLYQEAQARLDTWLGHLALGRAYLEAKGFIEAHSELDMCLKRRGEAVSIFLDDFPSYRYFAPLYYYLGRAQEGVKSPAAKESYKKFLKIREKADAGDPLVDDARRRLNNL